MESFCVFLIHNSLFMKLIDFVFIKISTKYLISSWTPSENLILFLFIKSLFITKLNTSCFSLKSKIFWNNFSLEIYSFFKEWAIKSFSESKDKVKSLIFSLFNKSSSSKNHIHLPLEFSTPIFLAIPGYILFLKFNILVLGWLPEK